MIKHLNNNQAGVTLVELLIGVTLLGLLVPVMISITSTVLERHDTDTGKTYVLVGIENTTQHIARDVMAAESLDVSDDSNTVSLTWQDPAEEGGETHTVVYTLEGDALYRGHSDSVWGASGTRAISSGIADVEFTPIPDGSDPEMLQLMITMSYKEPSRNETRYFEFTLRNTD